MTETGGGEGWRGGFGGFAENENGGGKAGQGGGAGRPGPNGERATLACGRGPAVRWDVRRNFLGRSIEDATDAFHKLRRRERSGEARPLHAHELVGHARLRLGRRVHDHGQEKRHTGRHVVGALGRQFPFAAKVAFLASLRVLGDERHEQGALANLFLDLRVPLVAAAQFSLVEPHLDAEGPQRVRDAPRGRGVFARVAEENGTGWAGGGHGRGELTDCFADGSTRAEIAAVTEVISKR